MPVLAMMSDTVYPVSRRWAAYFSFDGSTTDGRPTRRPFAVATATWRLGYRRRAGSRLCCQRASPSGDTRAYLANDDTEVCPEYAMSVPVFAPASAAWLRAECLSWCNVAPPVAASNSSDALR